MIQDVNHLVLIGTLTEDPKFSKTKNDEPMAVLQIATNKEWSEGNEIKKKTYWNSVLYFGNRAQACENYRKGMKVHLTAELGSRSSGDGDQREYKTTIVGVSSYVLDLGSKNRPSPSIEPADETTPF